MIQAGSLSISFSSAKITGYKRNISTTRTVPPDYSQPNSTSLMVAPTVDQSTPGNLSCVSSAGSTCVANEPRPDTMDVRSVHSTSDNNKIQELDMRASTRTSQNPDDRSNKFARKDKGRLVRVDRKKEFPNISESK